MILECGSRGTSTLRVFHGCGRKTKHRAAETLASWTTEPNDSLILFRAKDQKIGEGTYAVVYRGWTFVCAHS